MTTDTLNRRLDRVEGAVGSVSLAHLADELEALLQRHRGHPEECRQERLQWIDEYEAGLRAGQRFLDAEEALYSIYIEDRDQELGADTGGPDARA